MCSHMDPATETVESIHFGTKIKIRGHLRHDFAPPGKLRWFIYQIRDIPCNLLYTGSTIRPQARFAAHKSSCNSENSNSTGLSKHFMDGGCPFDRGRDKVTLKFTLVDFLDTSQEELEKEGHTSGAKCKCRVCLKLKLLEDKFILKSGTFYRNGLNSRNELQNKTRASWK